MRPHHGGNLEWAATIAHCATTDILDFSASINPLGPPSEVISALEAALGQLGHYPDPLCTHLRHILSQIHHLDPPWILVGNGSAELLTWAARELGEREQVWLVTPAFSDYGRALAAFGARVSRYPLINSSGQFQPDLQPLVRRLRSPLGVILNSPHNPTGHLWSRSDLIPFLDSGALVVVDEAFMDFLPPERDQTLISLVEEYPNLMILRSLTKFYALAGLRIGYVLTHPDRLARWQAWRDPWAVNSLALVAGVRSLGDRRFQEQTWAWLGSARDHLFAGLSAHGALTPWPSAANFILVESSISTSQLQRDLLTHHRILIRDCLSFPELGDLYFRVAVRSRAENERLLAALDDLLL
ncbi:threonine-phosphate decarboxylase CobD [Candidatus Synechococcus calcipolaris G9]|uniref:threonine-phosphate decarboxylase n=1 Tax=Candidatus Synechococcus calcipolaris G9 TaxID=1497997 RepID=A0ABT6F2Z5_9SYNE|nr:threonine-phosphate decarboxylase CobD [Candidatus Synechococcus calcipolaris]MDG2992152.1 threonine-phosphate decarboxylase CobD [Candidatus Synechococcus calcipolaris G9]